MTRQKSFKHRIRTRMEKTSESYSAARRQLIAASEKTHNGSAAETGEPVPPTQVAPGAPGDPAHDSGVASIRKAGDTVIEKTGRDWDQWFELLDRWDASTRPHPEIASWLSAEHGVAGWWAQSITVAYEQARGIRAPGQGRDGTYTVSASKTINVALEELFRAVEDPATRDRWLDPGRFQVTGVTAGKSVRGRSGGDTRVTFGFTAKGASKTLIGVAHSKIADPQTAKELKDFWTGRLKELKQLLES